MNNIWQNFAWTNLFVRHSHINLHLTQTLIPTISCTVLNSFHNDRGAVKLYIALYVDLYYKVR